MVITFFIPYLINRQEYNFCDSNNACPKIMYADPILSESEFGMCDDERVGEISSLYAQFLLSFSSSQFCVRGNL